MCRAALETGASATVGERTAQDMPQGPSHIAPIREQPAYAIAIGPKRIEPISTRHDYYSSPAHGITLIVTIEPPDLASRIRPLHPSHKRRRRTPCGAPATLP